MVEMDSANSAFLVFLNNSYGEAGAKLQEGGLIVGDANGGSELDVTTLLRSTRESTTTFSQ